MVQEHAHSDSENGQKLQKELEQDFQIKTLNSNIVALTSSVDKLTERIDKRIDESDKWRSEQMDWRSKQDSRMAVVETISHRLEKMFWLMGTACATAGITSGVALVMHLIGS